MCKTEPATLPPGPEISRGAAMAHGCCGGYRPPPAPVIPLERADSSCRGDCAGDNGVDDDDGR